jgi:hypothetical protein
MFTPKNSECPACGATYWKETAWKRVCLDCYIDTKRAEEGQPPRDRTKAKTKAESEYDPDDFWKKFNQQHQQRQQYKPPPQQPRYGASAGIETEMLRRLIQLCHPDKHNGSVASTTATQWLLKQKA